MEIALETFRVMFEGFILFGYITLGIIAFIKNRPDTKKLRLGFLSKIVFFIFCIIISPIFFGGLTKL